LNTDSFALRIRDGAGSLTSFPQTIMTGYSQTGSSPAAVVATVSGVLVLATAGTLIWDANCAFTNATGKSAAMNNGFYQRIA
jgi:hypothetical protein